MLFYAIRLVNYMILNRQYDTGRGLFENSVMIVVDSIAEKPARRKSKLSEAKQKTRKRFAEAAAYSKKVLADFKKKNPKTKTVVNGKSIYTSAVAEYLKQT